MRGTEAIGGNPILDFGIDRDALGYVGSDLQRPECILAEPDGTLWSADARGGVVRLARTGEQQIITQRRSEHFDQAGSEAIALPRGHAAERPGIRPRRRHPDLEFRHRLPGADVARRRVARAGGQHRRRADRQGELRPARFARPHLDHRLDAHQELDARAPHRSGRRLSRALRERHLPHRRRRVPLHQRDPVRRQARSSSTWSKPRAGGSPGCAIDERGDLRDREVFGPTQLGKGAWPDGIAFDSYGNLWGTLVYSDKLFVLTPEGDMRVLLDEGDPGEGRRARAGVLPESGDRGRAVRHRPGRRALDGERHLRRPGSADGLHRIAQGAAHSVLPRAGGRACRWCIGTKSYRGCRLLPCMTYSALRCRARASSFEVCFQICSRARAAVRAGQRERAGLDRVKRACSVMAALGWGPSAGREPQGGRRVFPRPR